MSKRLFNSLFPNTLWHWHWYRHRSEERPKQTPSFLSQILTFANSLEQINSAACEVVAQVFLCSSEVVVQVFIGSGCRGFRWRWLSSPGFPWQLTLSTDAAVYLWRSRVAVWSDRVCTIPNHCSPTIAVLCLGWLWTSAWVCTWLHW